MTIELLTAEKLKKVLQQQFPIDTDSWCRATDEVSDMSRHAREMLGLGPEEACNFHECNSPSKWNQRGTESIVRFYSMMSDQDKKAFLNRFEEWFAEWMED